jgi:short-chain Z-isoprenyl diphosphate synthase
MAERVAAPPLTTRPLVAAGRARRSLTGALLAPLYRLYTDHLRHEVRQAVVPHHVAVILDGNRRWASEAGLRDLSAGHRRGADKIDDLLDWCSDLGVGEVTLWALSGENLARQTGELAALLDVVAEKLDALVEHAARRPMRIRVFGRFDGFPQRLLEAIDRAESATAANGGLRLNIALGYSGRDELVDACRALVGGLAARGVAAREMAEHVSEETLAAHLYTAGAPDPDLIIRTSGEVRLSGFLPWQSAHSEFHFTDVYWPAFRELDFLRALRTYQQRERRYGK